MESTSDIKVGQVVKSRAGRDKGRVFVIVDVLDEKYILMSDGNLRTLEQPKKKKIKHLIVYNTVLNEIKIKIKNKEKINNAYVRKMLTPFNKEI